MPAQGIERSIIPAMYRLHGTAALLLLLSNLPLLSAAQPNVVVFIADDAGWGDYSHSGNRMLATPNIDSLARAGVSLEQFYVQPVCAPTRAEFLTGRWHGRCGVRGVSTGQERLDLDETTIADVLSKAGYATGAFGKWHNGSQWPYHPLARGFNEFFGYTSGHWGEYFDAPLEDNGIMIRSRGYIVDVCTDRAIDFIDRNQDRPFFCYVPFTTPHSPWAAPAADWQRFKEKPITQTASSAANEKADETRCALAMMENQDWNVGRVLDRLEQRGLSDNTIVVYFSDNGPNSHRWTGGLKGKKGATDEGGVRSVCFIRWPAQLPAGFSVAQIAAAVDLLPTLAAMTGVQPDGDLPLDGRNLMPLLMNQNVDWPPRMIFNTWANDFSVRSQTHRLDTAGSVYDLVSDPAQTSPINDTHPELVEELQSALQKWCLDVYGVSHHDLETGTGSKVASVVTQTMDPRPFPVGYREFPITMLPARDGEPRGTVQRSSGAPNCSYFVNWKSLDDSLVWLIDVHTAGNYSVTIDYTCKVSDAGSTLELSFLDSKLTGVVAHAWDPPLFTNQDTLPRPHGESPMKEFRTLDLGQVTLPAKCGPLILRATNIPGNAVMDLRRVTLTLLQ